MSLVRIVNEPGEDSRLMSLVRIVNEPGEDSRLMSLVTQASAGIQALLFHARTNARTHTHSYTYTCTYTYTLTIMYVRTYAHRNHFRL